MSKILIVRRPDKQKGESGVVLPDGSLYSFSPGKPARRSSQQSMNKRSAEGKLIIVSGEQEKL